MPEQTPYIMHVISQTHWDREWRYPFQQFRIMLVEMMDHLIDMLNDYPDYAHFHLDSQTVVLEDYLAVRPEKRKALQNLISAGRLVVGPWYTLPDPCVLSGESLVRNLLIGTQMTREFGGQHLNGYTPSGYGQVSQAPQIYQGFGIDNIFFYRGNNAIETKSEFLWEGPDGSQLLGFRHAEIFARANYWVHVYRPAVFNKWPFDWKYSWPERQLPFHQCDADSALRFDYYLLENTDGETYYPENIPQGLESLKAQALRDATTRHLLYMEGHDQTEAHPRVVEIIKDSNALGGDQFIHSSFAEYAKAVRAEANDLQVKRGEFRYVNVNGLWVYLYYGTLTARLYLKQNNRRCENALQGVAEPLCSTVWLLGAEYPAKNLEIAWKYLLQNQPHDSIAGCSVDVVHEDCEYRSRQSQQIADTLAMNSLGTLVKHIDGSGLPEDAIVLTVFNPALQSRREVAYAAIDLPMEQKTNGLRIEDVDGNVLPCQILSQETFNATVKVPREFPLPYAVRRYHVKFDAGTVPGLGYKTFVVKPDDTRWRNVGTLRTSHAGMENEHLAVAFHADGTFDLTDKATGKTYAGLHYYEDMSDVGDPWTRKTAPAEQMVTSLGLPAQLTCIEDGALSTTFRVTVPLTVPARALANCTRRSEEMTTIALVSDITLTAGSQKLEVETRFTNTARDHRLRVCFPTDLQADISYAESAFDVVTRPIPRVDDSTWKEPNPTAHPQLTFCDVTDGEKGLAVLNDGLPEYEVIDDARRTIALTLLRTYRFPMIGADPDATTEHPTEIGGQCLRPMTLRYALYPHVGDWEQGEVLVQGQAFNRPLRLAESGRPTGTLPMAASILSVDDRQVMLAAMKQTQQRDTLIVRLYNPTDHAISTTLTALYPITAAYRCALGEEREAVLDVTNGTTVPVTMPAKKIVTVELAPEWKRGEMV